METTSKEVTSNPQKQVKKTKEVTRHLRSLHFWCITTEDKDLDQTKRPNLDRGSSREVIFVTS